VELSLLSALTTINRRTMRSQVKREEGQVLVQRGITMVQKTREIVSCQRRISNNATYGTEQYHCVHTGITSFCRIV